MLKENYLNKFKELPEFVKQTGGLLILILIIISSFFVLNIMFGEGDELVKKMKLEEERIAQEKKQLRNPLVYGPKQLFEIRKPNFSNLEKRQLAGDQLFIPGRGCSPDRGEREAGPLMSGQQGRGKEAS